MSEQGDNASTRERIEEKASEAYDAVRERTHGLVDDMRQQAELLAERQKATIADRIEGAAAAVRKAAEEFDAQQQPMMAGYAGDVASAISNVSKTVRERGVGDMAADAEDIARQHPGLSLAGGVLLGFAAARFLRAIAAPRPRQRMAGAPAMQPPTTDVGAGGPV